MWYVRDLPSQSSLVFVWDTMAHSWFFLVNILLAQGLGSQALYRQKRVVHGIDAEIGEFPYLVSIQNTESNVHHCGGMMIDKYHALTAAHCVDGFLPEDFKVISGTVDLKKPYFTNFVSDIRVHENYNEGDSWKNDIAIIKVSQPFQINYFTAPARLPSQDENVPEYAKVILSGFGRTSAHSYSSKTLRKVEITIRNLKLCNQRYSKSHMQFRESQLCAYDADRRGICKGDSGGPLIFEDKIIGIVSYTSEGCSDSNYPAVFTKISKYVDWIHTNTRF